MIHVIAELALAPTEAAHTAFVDHFRWLEPLVRAEEGCLEYRGAVEISTAIAAQTPARGAVLIVIEKWTSEAALAAHLEAPHMAEFGRRTAGLMTGRTIRIARDISGPHAA
jgi:quinol monooxygenase YgiN